MSGQTGSTTSGFAALRARLQNAGLRPALISALEGARNQYRSSVSARNLRLSSGVPRINPTAGFDHFLSLLIKQTPLIASLNQAYDSGNLRTFSFGNSTNGRSGFTSGIVSRDEQTCDVLPWNVTVFC